MRAIDKMSHNWGKYEYVIQNNIWLESHWVFAAFEPKIFTSFSDIVCNIINLPSSSDKLLHVYLRSALFVDYPTLLVSLPTLA